MSRTPFVYWLGTTARELREAEGVSPTMMAARLGRREGAISTFESGKHLPQRLEAVLCAYATVAGLAGPRDVIQVALDAWRANEAKS